MDFLRTIVLHITMLTALGALDASANAADLSKIERRIAKEPAYRTKTPKYCLLVFGKEVRIRMWLVLDGDALYVDRNANGDLTDPGERVAPTPFRKVVMEPQENHPIERDFIVGDVVETNTKLKHTDLKVNHGIYFGQHAYSVHVLVKGQYEQVAGIPFADRPQSANIVHLNGPLTMALYGAGQSLSRGEGGSGLSFGICSRGLGIYPFAFIDYAPVPTNVHPVAEIEFPPRAPGARPIKQRIVLDYRC